MSQETPSRPVLSGIFRFRIVRFVVSGGGAALLFFVLSFSMLSFGAPPFLGTVVAYALAFCAAYLAQRAWTFEARHAHRMALPRYFVLQVSCALGAGLLAHVAGSWSAPPLLTSAVATLTAGAVSYFVSMRWVFPDDSERSE